MVATVAFGFAERMPRAVSSSGRAAPQPRPRRSWRKALGRMPRRSEMWLLRPGQRYPVQVQTSRASIDDGVAPARSQAVRRASAARCGACVSKWWWSSPAPAWKSVEMSGVQNWRVAMPESPVRIFSRRSRERWRSGAMAPESARSCRHSGWVKLCGGKAVARDWRYISAGGGGVVRRAAGWISRGWWPGAMPWVR